MFNKIDTDGDGSINREEFRHLMFDKIGAQLMVFDDMASLFRQEFKKADWNHSGELTYLQL